MRHLRPKTYYRNMNPLRAALIRKLYFIGKVKQVDLALMFDMAQGSVSRIISGHVWTHV